MQWLLSAAGVSAVRAVELGLDALDPGDPRVLSALREFASAQHVGDKDL